MSARLFAAVALLAAAPLAAAQAVNSASFFQPVPALDDVGLAGLMVLVGIAGGIATRIRRRK